MLYSVFEEDKKQVQEKRKQKRLFVSFPIECASLPEKKYFYTVSKDLSTSGARIVSDTSLDKGNPFKVNVNLINKVISIEAEIVWCNAENLQKRYSAGLKFKKINSDDEQEIARLIEQTNNS